MTKKWLFIKKHLDKMQFFVALVCLFLAVLCMFDYSNTLTATTFFPVIEPMKFNTSLGIFAIGLLLMARDLIPTSFARSLGLLISILGFLTLTQYLTGIDFGIDQFFRVARNLNIEHPGRMSMSASMCFIICGIIFNLHTLPQIKLEKYSIISFALSLVMTGIVSVPLLGYAFSTTAALDAGVFSHIALPIALVFLILGCFFTIKSMVFLAENKNLDNPLDPLFISIFLFLGFLLTWQVLINEEQKNFQSLIKLESESIKNELEDKLSETTLALKRLALRESYLGTKDKFFLSNDAEAYLNHFKIINRIGLIDKDYKVIWSYPQDMSWQVKNYNQSENPARKKALLKTWETKNPVLSSMIELKSGGSGFLLPVALENKKDQAKFLYATIDALKLFNNLKTVNQNNMNMAIYENGHNIFHTLKYTKIKSEMTSTIDVNIDNAIWKLEINPSPEFLIKNRSNAPYIILIGGAFFSFLIGLFLQSIYKAKRREKILAQKERILTDQLNIALSATQMAVWSMDLESGHTWRSENHDQIFGHDNQLAEWTKDTFFKHVIEEDRELIKNSFEQILDEAGQNSSRTDVRIIRSNDLSVRWIKVISQLQVNEENQSKQLMGIVHDITDEKNKEKKNFIDAEWIKAILNSTEYSIIATDEFGVIQTFNHAAEKMLGYSKEELLHKATPEIFHDVAEITTRAHNLSLEFKERIRPNFDVFIVKSRKLNQVDIQEWTYIRKDGTRFPISLAASALRDPSGKVVGFLGVGIDLTEDKKNKEQLRVAHERLERVIEATEEGIWERDFKTKEIKFIDNQARKVFGVKMTDNVSYEMMIDLIHPEDKLQLSQAIDIHVKQKTTNFKIEFRVKNPDIPHTWKWIRARGKVELNGLESSRLVSTVSDVTLEVERRTQLEEALRMASEATKVKSAFLASMSHEIRTPLNGIIGMTDLLLESELNADQHRFAEIVQNSGIGLLDLVNDILDFSKIESGKLDLENSDFTLPTLIENQIDLIVTRARKKNISLVTYISPDLPQTYLGDSGRIGQIILNLVSNAIKFTENGGVSLRVLPILDEAMRPNYFRVRFEIKDSGIGISQDNITKLFQPFSQADNKISRKFGGTGLGLSISKQLVLAMGGTIGVESTPGYGSTFWFELPLEFVGATNFFTRHSQIKNLQDMRVLVVDEDAFVTETVQSYLSSWKMRGVAVKNTHEMLEQIGLGIEGKDPFNVILIGMNPKVVESDKIHAVINKKFPDNHLQLIAMTEFEWNIKESEILGQGFFEVLKKPLKQSPLLDAIARSWSGERKVITKEETLEDINKNKDTRILIVDDVKTNRLLAVNMLEKMGYATHVVSSGKEALETLEQMKFDLVLMDCMMEEMSGIEATKLIRNLIDPIKRSIPIIAMTANVNAIDQAECLAAGMNSFISKPLFKENVKSVLDKVLIAENVLSKSGLTNVLLVDDNEENRTLIIHYLKNLPYSIEIAVDGLDAFNKFQAGKFDVVLMDVQMPVMDGYQSTESIRNWEKENNKIPTLIIALTANALKEQCDKALEVGCNDYLTKPIRKQKLVDYLQNVVTKNAA